MVCHDIVYHSIANYCSNRRAMLANFHPNSKLPRVKWLPKVSNIIILSNFRHPLSTWGIYILVNPHPILKFGTHKSTNPHVLQFIATIFTLEQVSSATPTKLYIPSSLYNLIQEFSKLTHRQKMKNPYNLFLRRIELLIKNIPYSTTFHMTQPSQLKSKLPTPTNGLPSTTLQCRIAAPQYYLFDTYNQQIITAYPRTYLKEFFHSLQFEEWCKTPTLQNTKPRRYPCLPQLIHNLPFSIRTESYCTAALNNRLPSLRLLHHIPPFTSYQVPSHQCLLCQCQHTHTPTTHFLSCPFNKTIIKHLQTIQMVSNESSFPLPVPNGLPNPYTSTKEYIVECLTNNIPLYPANITSFFRIFHGHTHLRSISQRNKCHCKLLQNHHRQFLSTLSSKVTLCYTDGSYHKKTTKAQSATLIYSPTSSSGIEIITLPKEKSPLEAELVAIYTPP